MTRVGKDVNSRPQVTWEETEEGRAGAKDKSKPVMSTVSSPHLREPCCPEPCIICDLVTLDINNSKQSYIILSGWTTERHTETQSTNKLERLGVKGEDILPYYCGCILSRHNQTHPTARSVTNRVIFKQRTPTFLVGLSPRPTSDRGFLTETMT